MAELREWKERAGFVSPDISDSLKNGLHQVSLEESSTSERMDPCKVIFSTPRWWAILMISVLEKLMFCCMMSWECTGYNIITNILIWLRDSFLKLQGFRYSLPTLSHCFPWMSLYRWGESTCHTITSCVMPGKNVCFITAFFRIFKFFNLYTDIQDGSYFQVYDFQALQERKESGHSTLWKMGRTKLVLKRVD